MTKELTEKENKKIDELIEKGIAKQIHLYNPSNIFRPRGIGKKEALGVDLLEKAKRIYNDWIDENYGDHLDPDEATRTILINMVEETEYALKLFLKEVQNPYIRDIELNMIFKNRSEK
jgi:hypothetical protein